MRLLLIEDDLVDAHIFRTQLKKASDVEVTVETSVGDGIDRCTHEAFDLVVLDLTLPDSAGLATLRTFQSGVVDAPAILVLTGLEDETLALDAVKAGAQDFVVKGGMGAATLVQACRHAIERHRMSQELMAANDRVRHLATHCSLTHLPNRYLFMDRLGTALKNAPRSGSGLAVVFLDLDRFKPINDGFGHAAGDRVLREVADRLRASVRASDTIARLGGDEFTVLLPGVRDRADAERIARKLVEAVARPMNVEGRSVSVHASAGAAIYPSGGSTAEAILRNADAAMFQAKRRGEGLRLWSTDLSDDARGRFELENDLARAVEQDALEVHYQPQLDGQTGRIIGFEALARWNRGAAGWVAPLEFVPLAEATGLIHDLGENVLRRAMRDQRRWSESGFGPGRVAVNVSPTQLRSGRFVERVLAILDEEGLPGDRLELEITESCLVENTTTTVAALEALRARDIAIAVDDFGTGYSSLGLLPSLPLDALKVDRRFVEGVAHDARLAATTRAIVRLGIELGFEVIAEGVENEEQRAFLLDNDCPHMQGFLFSAPLREADAHRAACAGRFEETGGRWSPA